MKVLLAEEDRKLGKTIQEMLRRQDIETDWVPLSLMLLLRKRI